MRLRAAGWVSRQQMHRSSRLPRETLANLSITGHYAGSRINRVENRPVRRATPYLRCSLRSTNRLRVLKQGVATIAE
jgi:hypothetical protein